MKITDLRWIFVGLLAVWLVQTFISSAELTNVFTLSNNQLVARTNPFDLGCSLVLLVLYLFLVNAKVSNTAGCLPGVFRIFIAFWIDLIAMVTLLAPIMAFIPLFAEWVRTSGDLQWALERTATSTGEIIFFTSLLFVGLLLTLLYFAIPMMNHRPTPGACVMGYRIVPDSGTALTLKKALLRTCVGFVAACAAWAAPFLGRNREEGKFWLDLVFSTHAVKLN